MREKLQGRKQVKNKIKDKKKENVYERERESLYCFRKMRKREAKR
jgi:hypothetical protein